MRKNISIKYTNSLILFKLLFVLSKKYIINNKLNIIHLLIYSTSLG